MAERTPHQLLASSFLITDIGDQTALQLQTLLSAQQVTVTAWDLNGAQHRYAEAFYNTIAEAERNYNLHCVQSPLRLFIKRAMTTIWVSGLPAVLSARDLFTSLQEATPGLHCVTVPKNPE